MDIKNLLTKPVIALSVSMFGAGFVFNNISLEFKSNSDYLMVLILIILAFIARKSSLLIVKFINSFK
mgnify:CR=1 FL=1